MSALLSTFESILKDLRWKEDQLIINHFNEKVWLKPLIVNGNRVGITECCYDDNPCHRHAAIAAQNVEVNG